MNSALRLANRAAIEPRLLNRRDAAVYLAVCSRTLKNLTKRGELPEVRLAGAVRYDQADLDRLIDDKKSGKPQ
jgi:Helix-turn-helix domain